MPAFAIPAILAPLAAFLTSIGLGRFANAIFIAIFIKIIAAIGLSIVVYTGVDLAIGALQTEVDNLVASLATPFPQMLAITQRMGVVDFINMQFAAMTSVITIKGVSGAVKQIKFT